MAKNLNEVRNARGILRNGLTLIPNLLKLLIRLFKDSRVPVTEKAFVIGAIVYFLSPFDLLPDMIPFLGQIDDLYLIALTILRLFNRTNDSILREHWDGGGDIANMVDIIIKAATFILPRRIRRVLRGRIEIAPQIEGGLISSPGDPQPIESVRQAKKRWGRSIR
ncbi:MAG: DUF1232 domain-containing protein [Acidobacteria bacterium]|nr:DUF1232 domain-containing protein [Acidobacteriota bacterium]